MLTHMLASTGGAISQSPLAPPIPQAQPRQKQQQQQQQKRKSSPGHQGHLSHPSDDRPSPRGEEGKYNAYGHGGLPPGGQFEQQRSGTRFGNRSPTSSAGQNRQREVTRSPALVCVCLSVCLSVSVCLSAVGHSVSCLVTSKCLSVTGK